MENASLPRTSDVTTAGIRIHAAAQFEPSVASPETGHYGYTYRIVIENQRDEQVQLITRKWVVGQTDGKQHQVRGPGLRAVQPILPPGLVLCYRSICPLGTVEGFLEGELRMERVDGSTFEVAVGRIGLAYTRGKLEDFEPEIRLRDHAPYETPAEVFASLLRARSILEQTTRADRANPAYGDLLEELAVITDLHMRTTSDIRSPAGWQYINWLSARGLHKQEDPVARAFLVEWQQR